MILVSCSYEAIQTIYSLSEYTAAQILVGFLLSLPSLQLNSRTSSQCTSYQLTVRLIKINLKRKMLVESTQTVLTKLLEI